MTTSFTFHSTPAEPHPADPSRAVLVTGAAGRIGSFFCRTHADRYNLTLMVRPGAEVPDDLATRGKVVEADIRDPDSLRPHFEGIDTVVHLAANPSPRAEWAEVLDTNIVGTYHVMETARAAGCRRVVFASSIHAVSGYPEGYQVHDDEPVNPGDLYGVSKCFGEALGRYMATQRGMSVIAVRIGAFQPADKAKDPGRVPLMNAFVAREDLAQLLRRCVDDTNTGFALFHGLSNNRFNRMDISGAKETLGYDPEHDFTEENPALEPLHLRDQVKPHNERKT